MDAIEAKDVFLEPTDAGKELGISGQAVNKLLEKYGYQNKITAGWEPTKTSEGKYTRHAWNRKNKSGYNYKWSLELIKALIKD